MKRQIGWQKFEETVDDQLKSPIVRMITDHHNSEIERFFGDDSDIVSDMEGEEKIVSAKPMIAVPTDVGNEIYMSSAYDCWVGHVNFSLNEELDEKIAKAYGVEASKVYTRYRFVIGVGRLFNASKVKTAVEKSLGIAPEQTGLLF